MEGSGPRGRGGRADRTTVRASERVNTRERWFVSGELRGSERDRSQLLAQESEWDRMRETGPDTTRKAKVSEARGRERARENAQGRLECEGERLGSELAPPWLRGAMRGFPSHRGCCQHNAAEIPKRELPGSQVASPAHVETTPSRNIRVTKLLFRDDPARFG